MALTIVDTLNRDYLELVSAADVKMTTKPRPAPEPKLRRAFLHLSFDLDCPTPHPTATDD
jgi:hypothetical protein